MQALDYILSVTHGSVCALKEGGSVVKTLKSFQTPKGNTLKKYIHINANRM